MEKEIKVWDPLIRLFHWGLVGAFVIAWLTAEDDFADIHVVAGYTIFALVAVRLVWGVIGTRHARFSQFVTHPREAWGYLTDLVRFKARHYIGHNPAAAWMILALLLFLTLTGISGMMLYGAEEQAGPMATLMAPFGAWEDGLEELHEFLAGFTLALVGLHVAGVLVSSLAHRENLIRAMITGRKPVSGTSGGADGSGLPDAVPSLRRWRAVSGLAIVFLLAAAVAQAGVIDERLEAYRAKGAGPFSAAAGQPLWQQARTVEGETRRCGTCHTDDLMAGGKHVETGKAIEPLSPAASPERLTDAKKIEKWFLRNCKWTLGRVCTPQEKGDFLLFIAGHKTP